MANNILTATVATVKLGHLEFEGLMFEDGTYGIAVPQICSIFQFLIKNTSRDIKALLGKDFQFLKAHTTLHPKAVNVLQLIDFEKLLFELMIKGSPIAVGISRDLIGLSLTQLFSDAFGKKFEKEERQVELRNRQEERRKTKETIKEMETAIRNWSENGKRFAITTDFWVHFYNQLDFGLFGKFAKAIREEQFDKHALIRDGMGVRALSKIRKIQYCTMRNLNNYTHPWIALEKALKEYDFPIEDWRI